MDRPGREKNILWWGRSDTNYSRNGILRQSLLTLGFSINDFRPWHSRFGAMQANLCSLGAPDYVWVPCFRQRDMWAARRWCDKTQRPMIFDPLISAYDKQVFEKKKFLPDSVAARTLLQREQKMFQAADFLVADTVLHAEYFSEILAVPRETIHVIPVSADETVFYPMERKGGDDGRLKILFYGSFLELHGMDVIAETILAAQNLPVIWRLIGNGPMQKEMKNKLATMPNIQWDDWVEYEQLPHAIAEADVVLGVFGEGQKASRVIPNKVYQAMACGRPVVTMRSGAYPTALRELQDAGIVWVRPGEAQDLLVALQGLLAKDRAVLGTHARENYLRFFSNQVVLKELSRIFSCPV